MEMCVECDDSFIYSRELSPMSVDEQLRAATTKPNVILRMCDIDQIRNNLTDQFIIHKSDRSEIEQQQDGSNQADSEEIDWR